jgi:predicted nucleic acid-binding protein
MGERYLLDTNTVIYYLDGNLPIKALDFIDIQLAIEGNISVITQIELLSWTPPNPNDFVVVEQFVRDTDIFTLNTDIINQTIFLRKSFKIKLPDAIIAATALAHNFTLISRNVDDFKKIPNLKFINPFTDI